MTTIFDEVARATYEKARSAVDETAPAVLSSPTPGTELPMEDTPELRAAVEESDILLLLPTLVHLTGDVSWLDRAAPHIQPLGMGGAQIPAELQKAIRDALLAALTGPARDALPLSEGMLKRITSVIVGEPVTDEYIPLLIEQMGFQPTGRFVPEQHRRAPEGYRVAIIGAGLSGMVAGIRLAESGYDYRIFERESELGGVWWSNKYPGVGVDTPSHFYSLSFHLNPDWPRYFSEGHVLMDYWRQVAERFRLRDHISFRTIVESCVWDEATSLWTVTSVDAEGRRESDTYNAVISATGMFNNPALPNLPGLADFKGLAVHTAHWDPATDVKGKRVVQIGTGASGLQAGPRIAKEAARHTVFQRTPPWIVLMPDGTFMKPTTASLRWALRHIPHFAQWMRFYTYWNASDGLHRYVVRDPAWPESDTSINAFSEGYRQFLQGMLEQRMADRPDLLAKLTPNYPPMGKRILQDSHWFEMLKRDNVDLVTDGIERITEDGVLARDGTSYPADILLLATGFKISGMMQHLRIAGRDGVTLRDVWGEEDPAAYLGTMVPGFPNFFLISGPNAGASHGAGVNVYSESQMHYIMTCLDALIAHGATTIEPTQEAHDAWNARIGEALEQTVWNHPNVSTYYRNSKGRNIVSCPWRIVDIWHMLREPDPREVLLK